MKEKISFPLSGFSSIFYHIYIEFSLEMLACRGFSPITGCCSVCSPKNFSQKGWRKFTQYVWNISSWTQWLGCLTIELVSPRGTLSKWIMVYSRRFCLLSVLYFLLHPPWGFFLCEGENRENVWVYSRDGKFCVRKWEFDERESNHEILYGFSRITFKVGGFVNWGRRWCSRYISRVVNVAKWRTFNCDLLPWVRDSFIYYSSWWCIS